MWSTKFLLTLNDERNVTKVSADCSLFTSVQSAVCVCAFDTHVRLIEINVFHWNCEKVKNWRNLILVWVCVCAFFSISCYFRNKGSSSNKVS